ncbi:hypothetical protein [Longitalea arenae]|uniref:hypothetical protein n=1 Tax=Longitalea arenae TaxID=2812558 RepID=UPI0019679D2F|nr:hypothetical protein [Longitalea arenae]
MRRIVLIIFLVGVAQSLCAQYVYTIKADSVKITNTCDTAELIIENHSQDVPGFLFNKGRGRTEFRRGLQKSNDSIYVIGGDTLRMNAWLQGGNRFGTIGSIGTMDNNPIDFYSNSAFRGRISNSGNFLWGTTTEDGRWKMEVETGSVGAIKAINRFDVWALSPTQSSSVVISNGNFGPYLTLGVAGGYYAWSPMAIPSDAVISTRPQHRLILSSKVVIMQNNTLVGTNVDNGNRLQVSGTTYLSDTLKMPNILSKSDTVNYKPVAIDANGNVVKMAGWNLTQLNRTAVNDAGYSVLSSDYLIAYTALTAARTVTLPSASGMTNKVLIIKDESGAAATYNITVNVSAGGTIDGAASKVISTNYGLIELYSNGLHWFTK